MMMRMTVCFWFPLVERREPALILSVQKRHSTVDSWRRSITTRAAYPLLTLQAIRESGRDER